MAFGWRSVTAEWPLVIPPVSVAVLGVTWGRDIGTVLVLAVAVVLVGAVLAAVHHAEVVAHKVGEPFACSTRRVRARHWRPSRHWLP